MFSDRSTRVESRRDWRVNDRFRVKSGAVAEVSRGLSRANSDVPPRIVDDHGDRRRDGIVIVRGDSAYTGADDLIFDRDTERIIRCRQERIYGIGFLMGC